MLLFCVLSYHYCCLYVFICFLMKVQAAVAGCHTKCRLQQWAGTLSAAESYPTSEVRDSCPECQAAMSQERPEGATRHWRSGEAAERSYFASQVSGGREETAHVRGQERPGEATSCPKPGAVTLRSHPKPEARAGGREEQPEEQWLSKHRRA